MSEATSRLRDSITAGSIRALAEEIGRYAETSARLEVIRELRRLADLLDGRADATQ